MKTGTITLFVGTMQSGKSTQLLQTSHMLQQTQKRVAITSVGDRKNGHISSRLGISQRVDFEFTKGNFAKSFAEYFVESGEGIDYILIDECQFLDSKDVQSIVGICDTWGIDFYLFGLKTDFLGNLFDGTKFCIEVADEIKEMNTPSLCECGNKALYNARFDENGNMQTDGEVVQIGDNYVILCRKHYNEQYKKRQ